MPVTIIRLNNTRVFIGEMEAHCDSWGLQLSETAEGAYRDNLLFPVGLMLLCFGVKGLLIAALNVRPLQKEAACFRLSVIRRPP